MMPVIKLWVYDLPPFRLSNTLWKIAIESFLIIKVDVRNFNFAAVAASLYRLGQRMMPLY